MHHGPLPAIKEQDEDTKRLPDDDPKLNQLLPEKSLPEKLKPEKVNPDKALPETTPETTFKNEKKSSESLMSPNEPMMMEEEIDSPESVLITPVIDTGLPVDEKSSPENQKNRKSEKAEKNDRSSTEKVIQITSLHIKNINSESESGSIPRNEQQVLLINLPNDQLQTLQSGSDATENGKTEKDEQFTDEFGQFGTETAEHDGNGVDASIDFGDRESENAKRPLKIEKENSFDKGLNVDEDGEELSRRIFRDKPETFGSEKQSVYNTLHTSREEVVQEIEQEIARF